MSDQDQTFRITTVLKHNSLKRQQIKSKIIFVERIYESL